MERRECHCERVRLVGRILQLLLALKLDPPLAVQSVCAAAHLSDEIVVVLRVEHPVKVVFAHRPPDLRIPVAESVGALGDVAPIEVLDARSGKPDLAHPVGYAPTDAHIIYHQHIHAVRVAVGLQNAGHFHCVVAANSPHDTRHPSLPPHHDRMIMPLASHIARHDDLALRFKLPLNGGLCDAQGHHHLVRVLRKLPQHRADVHRSIFAPVLLAVFHILQCYHPRNDDPTLLDVGRIIRADLHRLPQVAMPVMRVVEDAVVDERVASQKQQRRVEPLHRVDIIGRHGVRLGYHRKQVGRVIAQNLVRRVSSEANGESLLIYIVAILEHLARKLLGSLPVCELHLVPDNVLHLPQRGSRNDRLCGRVPMHPPQDDSRRSPVLP